MSRGWFLPASVLVAFLGFFMVGCEDAPFHSFEEDDNGFRITSLSDGQIVSQRWGYALQGSGLKNVAVSNSKVEIFTDKWWLQEGARVERVGNRSDWITYVNLGGMHQYNDHTIRVTVTYSDGSTDTVEVGGIVVRE